MIPDEIWATAGACYAIFWRATVALIVIALFRFYIRRSSILRTFSRLGIPGPLPGFWLGNLKFRGYDQNKRSDIDRWFMEYGNTFGYYDAGRPVLVTKDHQIIQQAFISRALDFPNRLKFPMNIEPFKSSILSTRDKRWRTVRKMLTPTFTAHKVCQESTKDSITISIRRTLNALNDPNVSSVLEIGSHSETLKTKKPIIKVNCNKVFQLFTLDVISKIAFNIDESDVFQPNSELVNMVEEFETGVDGPDTWLCRMFPFLVTVIEFLAGYVDLIKMVAVFDKHLNKLIEEYHSKKEAEEKMNDSVSTQEYENSEEEKAKKTVFDFMLYQERAGNLTKNETIGNLMVILFAGYETTASCLMYTIWCLAQNPKFQDRLREELSSLIHVEGNSGNDRLESILEQVHDIKCEYLDRIIFESLRLYPPVVAFVSRELSGNLRETMIGDYRFTSDMAIEFPVWTMHHCADSWPSPFTFNPDRDNLPIPGSGVKNLSFAGFGLGQRQCIGMNLALYELRQMLATLILTYRFKIPDDFNITLDDNSMFPMRCAGELLKPVEKIILDFEII